jgi:quinol---cytochrome c reductase iron-sulfur subunit, bacillus type
MTEERRTIPSRRDFIRSTSYWVAGLVGTAIVAPAIASLISPVFGQSKDAAWVDLGPLGTFPLGLPTLVEFTRTQVNGWERTGMAYGVFVLRRDDTNVRVLSNICTHLGCHVNWHPELQHYVSPCHDGQFDVLGRNISGPPPRPLDEYESRIEGGVLQIKLPAFRRTS